MLPEMLPAADRPARDRMAILIQTPVQVPEMQLGKRGNHMIPSLLYLKFTYGSTNDDSWEQAKVLRLL